jgi:hypothetical protein
MKRPIVSVVLLATLALSGLFAPALSPLLGSASASTYSRILPKPPLARGGMIESTSCVAGPVCVSIGWNHHGNNPYLWAERWQDGQWAALPPPHQGNLSGQTFPTISCTTKTWCMATGSNEPMLSNHPFAEELVGSHWTTLRIPIVKNSTDFSLFHLDCRSSTWCVGVGNYVANQKNYSDATFLVSEVWNGSTWQIVPVDSPRTYAPQTDPGMVNGGAHPTASPQELSCVSKKFCVFTGFFWNGVFVEQWNGHRWSKVAAPNDPLRPAGDSEFSGGTCVSTTFCVATGGYAVSNAAWRPLIEQWNGQTWQIATLPKLPQYFNGKPGFRLTNVECSSSKFCEAFGDPGFATRGVNGLTWNGRTWRYVTTAHRTDPALVCLTHDYCEPVD